MALTPHGGAIIYDPPQQNVKIRNTLRDNAIVSSNSQHPCEGAITQHIYVDERYILSDAPFFMAGTPGD
ncbi:hypothetical protein GCM10020001_115100 [Nonomuraea salmonea]